MSSSEALWKRERCVRALLDVRAMGKEGRLFVHILNGVVFKIPEKDGFHFVQKFISF